MEPTALLQSEFRNGGRVVNKKCLSSEEGQSGWFRVRCPGSCVQAERIRVRMVLLPPLRVEDCFLSTRCCLPENGLSYLRRATGPKSRVCSEAAQCTASSAAAH